jgi:outer membrane protein OmpA-like peptidoglycan-associated protein
MITPSKKNETLDQIKSLLLGDELCRLDKVETVALRVDDSARLATATAEVLVDALRATDIARHQELANALAPAVIATLREELEKTREPRAEPPKPTRRTPLIVLGVLFIAGSAWAEMHLLAHPDHAAELLAKSDHSTRVGSSNEIAQLRSQLAETLSSLGEIRRQADSEPAKLRRFIDNFAVFFARDDTLANPAAVRAGLDELAGLLKSTGEKLRVVGYAEEAGSVGVKSITSRRRAEKVVSMLVERGVLRENLAAVARGRLSPISDFSTGAPRSRRVVFERPYQGEFELVE